VQGGGVERVVAQQPADRPGWNVARQKKPLTPDELKQKLADGLISRLPNSAEISTTMTSRLPSTGNRSRRPSSVSTAEMEDHF
jgi:hypothetical protein